MRRQECGSNAMVTVQMTVEEYLEMKSRQETKSRLHFCRHARPDLASFVSGNLSFFETSKRHFQPRFRLSVSPDYKMCVRVTNTGEIFEEHRRDNNYCTCNVILHMLLLFQRFICQINRDVMNCIHLIIISM